MVSVSDQTKSEIRGPHLSMRFIPDTIQFVLFTSWRFSSWVGYNVEYL